MAPRPPATPGGAATEPRAVDRPAPGHSRTVRIATFNILHGRSPVDDRVDVERLAAAVKTLDADVLGLQEVDRDQPRPMGAGLTAVAPQAMGAVGSPVVAGPHGPPGGPGGGP